MLKLSVSAAAAASEQESPLSLTLLAGFWFSVLLLLPVSQADLSLVTYVRECLLCGFELLCAIIVVVCGSK